ncbi:hypothetical protein [Oceanospirillum sanctuarii]|uniref:hypothetical protein n=1 Tax=Oceanospirillum sanctuarii TaxID=1434821 RepID=UPI000A3A773A|nr:hypothetical protein [Oceanospirillum sanctuarii]
MPLPFIVVLVAGAAGVYGAGKSIQASSDNSKAREINERARKIVDSSESSLSELRNRTNKNLDRLGAKKISAISSTLTNFVSAYSQLKGVDFSEEIDDGFFDWDEAPSVEQIRNDCELVSGVVTGGGFGAVVGSVAAFGTYGLTSSLAAASTGTGIGSLSGVAASNATLAWLGGGSLASGGMGIAGGTMVLGGLVTGPALLVFGAVLGAKAERNLSDAKSNEELAVAFSKECDAASAKLLGILAIAKIQSDILSLARASCRRLTNELGAIIDLAGTDFKMFSREQQELVFKTVKTAQLVRCIVDIAIMDEDGAILGDSESKLTELSDFI